MSGWSAVVPIKPPAERKTRLRARLDPAARIALSEAMLAHVLDTLACVDAVGNIAILARDRPAGRAGGWMRDEGHGLNAALGGVARRIPARLLILHADLPALAAADISALIDAAEAGGAGGAALAPDRHGQGTNALALVQPAGFPFAFGSGSLQRHRAALPEARIVQRPGLSLDIDEDADLTEAIRSGALPPLPA